MISIGSRLGVVICWQQALVVKHLRDFHSEVQTLCSLKADVADGTVAQEAANTQTPAEVTVVGDVQERLQGGGLAAAQGGAQRPNALITPSHRGQEAVQWMAEEAGQKDCSTKVSGKERK